MTVLADSLADRLQEIALAPPQPQGVLTRVSGMLLAARGIRAPLGACCEVHAEGGSSIAAEVVGFRDGEIALMPLQSVHGLLPGTAIRLVSTTARVGVGPGMLGRVLDGMGMPFDGGPAIPAEVYLPLRGTTLNPLQRGLISEPLDVGIRAINGLLTVGRGQRVGLMAGSGVGKSTLLGMMTRFTEADVVVIGLIGERGREVLEFVRETLGSEALKRAVVIAAPGDTSPVIRLRATHLASTVAEYYRDRGKRVLLLMDSLTRVAHAQREIGLAVGEPPTTKGYTPSVFSLISSIVERAGASSAGGSITGIYTVLAEGDDQSDPIVDAARAILDGHFVLSRDIAARGQYPALDISLSVSRLASKLLESEQRQMVQKFRRLLAAYEEGRDLISVGAYRPGGNPDLDEALARWPRMLQFLMQETEQAVGLERTFAELKAVLQ
jgi:flagellum-specific ATP synthase